MPPSVGLTGEKSPFNPDITRAMAATPSTMLPLGTPAPDFSLPDTNGQSVSLSDFRGASALVVFFICNHCPYVKHLRAELAPLAREYQQKGVAIVGINSNDATNYPDDSPEKMAEEVRNAGYTFPYLYDESQAVAKAFHAACTPDFFVFNRELKLVYRGQFDDSRPGNNLPVTGKDLRASLDAVLSGRTPPQDQKPSIGCNIKWRPGNEPSYS
jgi:peroxiredoxin